MFNQLQEHNCNFQIPIFRMSVLQYFDYVSTSGSGRKFISPFILFYQERVVPSLALTGVVFLERRRKQWTSHCVILVCINLLYVLLKVTHCVSTQFHLLVRMTFEVFALFSVFLKMISLKETITV